MRVVTSGATRVVILIGPYAIKIAKLIRLRYAVTRIVDILRTGQAREKAAEWKRERGQSVFGVVRQALIGGVHQNRLEYHRYVDYPDLGLMPTLWTFFYVVNVQRRGEPLPAADMPDHPILHYVPLGTQIGEDIMRPEQFCNLGDRPYLVDYGHDELEDVLAEARNRRAMA